MYIEQPVFHAIFHSNSLHSTAVTDVKTHEKFEIGVEAQLSRSISIIAYSSANDSVLIIFFLITHVDGNQIFLYSPIW